MRHDISPLRRAILTLALLLVALLIALPTPQAQAQAVSDVHFAFKPVSGASLDELSAGAEGSGILIYYTTANGADKPALAVRLSKAAGALTAKAEVYGGLAANASAVRTANGVTTIESTLKPDIVIISHDGWWVRDGVTSYNLDIETYGPIASMWGAPANPTDTVPAWVSHVTAGELATRVRVSDPQHTGLPQWDLRNLIPAFRNSGYIRFNYAERKCDTAVVIDKGISPPWPFVAASVNAGQTAGAAALAAYEQRVGTFRPPIVVDWSSGKITYFSELVTVRNQNCSYSVYGINALLDGKRNQSDFEAPFAFYDTSGAGQGYPNLLLRTQREPVDNPWFLITDPQYDNRAIEHDLETIRYSWKDGVGDGTWDYKIEVLGFTPYTDTTNIAGGLLSIDAPDYAAFPRWVTDQSWPVATFIEPETIAYRSSEGIYDWFPLQLDVPFLMGWRDQPRAAAFTVLAGGLRGEYRYHRSLAPELYFSPVDNRLHMLGAEAGMLPLDDLSTLREGNLDDGLYINSWRREITGTNGSPVVTDALYAPGSYLVYAGASESGQPITQLRRADYAPASFITLPPSDKVSAAAFSALITPLRNQRRNANDLRAWLDGFPGADLTLTGAALSDFRIVPGGFRFALDVADGFGASGTAPGLEKISPGNYSVSYDGQFHLTTLTPHDLSATVSPPVSPQQHQAGLVTVRLSNSGQQDAPPATLELLAVAPSSRASVVDTTTVTLLAGATLTATLQWAPSDPGAWTLKPRLIFADDTPQDFDGAAATVLPMNAPTVFAIIGAALGSPTGPLLLLAGLALAALAASIVRQRLLAASDQLDVEEA